MSDQVPVPAVPPRATVPVLPERQQRGAAPAEVLRWLISVLRRRWIVFAAVFAMVLALSIALTFRQKPQFTATATLLVNSRLLNVQQKDSDVVPEGSAEDKAVQSEIQIVGSSDIARQVIAAMEARYPGYGQMITRAQTPPPYRAILNSVQGRLKVDRPGGTNVLGITFTAPDAKLAAETANEFVEQYLRAKIDKRLDAARSADQSLRHELDLMRARVEESDRQVADYRRSHNLLSANGATLTEQEQSLYKQQDAAAQTQLAEERARLSTAQSQLAGGSSGGDVGEALNSSVVNALRSQRAQASAHLAELQARYQPGHPDVIKAKQQLADIDSEIQAEIGRVVSNLQARVSVARQRASAAGGIASASRGELAANTAASVELNELERRAEALRTNYAGMLERQTAVVSQSVVADVDARLLSPALTPERPSSPNRKLDLALGIAIATALATAAVALLQLFDQTIVSSQEAEDAFGLRHVVNVPLVPSRARSGDAGPPIDVVVDQPLSMIAEAMRSLLLVIEQASHESGAIVVGITSARAEEGKSTTAACLARVAAISGRRTLLIDGDIRRPSIAGLFGFKPQAGLTEVLAEAASLKDTLLLDERSGAWILPSLAQPFEHRQINSQRNLHTLMQRATEVFDLVIIDTAPALAAVESRLLMNFVDQAYMAVRWKHTPIPVVRAALRRLASIGVEVQGVVMTKVNMRSIAAYAYDDVDYAYEPYVPSS